MKKPTKEQAKSQKMRRAIEVSQGGVVNPWKVGLAQPGMAKTFKVMKVDK